MKKFCQIHRFFYESTCPFCTKDKYRNVVSLSESKKEDKRDITNEDISKLINHFKDR